MNKQTNRNITRNAERTITASKNRMRIYRNMTNARNTSTGTGRNSNTVAMRSLIAPNPSQAVMKLKPYETVKQQALFLQEPTTASKLDWNESTVKPAPEITEAVIKAIRESSLNWYPDVNSFALTEKLAEYTGLPKEFIQTFPGSDASLEYTCRTYLDAGDEVLMAGPTYDNFRIYAESCGATVITHLGKSPFNSDAPGLITDITPLTKIIYIVSPNNPTGTLYSESDIRTILEAAPETLVIVDEAYFEFCGLTHALLVRDYPNLLISRSFSKAFGLAALRCGYVISDPQNIGFLNRIRVGKNLSLPAQAGAIAALENYASIDEFVQIVRTNMDILTLTLSEIDVEVTPTVANFVMVNVARPDEVVRFLQSRNIYVRNRASMPQLEGYVRITVGDDIATERVFNAFRDMPKEYYLLDKSKANNTTKTLQPGSSLTLRRGPEQVTEQNVTTADMVDDSNDISNEMFVVENHFKRISPDDIKADLLIVQAKRRDSVK